MRQSHLSAGAPSSANTSWRIRWPPSPRARARLSRVARFSVSGLAVALVTGIIWHLGPRLIWDNLYRVGWKISFVFLLGFPRFLVNTIGWRLLLPKQSFSLAHLYRVKIAGELLTRATPLHFFGGDAARVLLLGKKGNREGIAASVLMDRTATSIGGAFFILTGLTGSLFLLPIDSHMKIILVILAVLIFLSLFLLVFQQKKGFLTAYLHLLKKIRLDRLFSPKRLDSWKIRAASFDQTVKTYFKDGHSLLTQVTAINYAARLIGVVEIYLLFRFLDIPLAPVFALIFNAASLLLTATFFIVPGTLGLAEGTYGLFFHLLSLDPAVGVSLELLRKINALIWFAFGGLLSLTFRGRKGCDPLPNNHKRYSAACQPSPDPLHESSSER